MAYPNATFENYYNQILAGLQGNQVNYAMPSMGELTAQIAAYLRPSYDQAIAGRQTQTQRYGTDLDVDAASRGMGRSSYVTDAKGKLQQAEATDIANLESNYGAALGEALLNQYNQHLANKLNTDTINAQLRAQLEQSAYDRAGDMYSLTKKGSGGKNKSNLIVTELVATAMDPAVNKNPRTTNALQEANKNLYDSATVQALLERGYTIGDIEAAKSYIKSLF